MSKKQKIKELAKSVNPYDVRSVREGMKKFKKIQQGENPGSVRN